jgi:hypothetical protein
MDGTSAGQHAAGALQRHAPSARKPDECGISGAEAQLLRIAI